MRQHINYGEQAATGFAGMEVDWIGPGFYKIRSRPFGYWIPAEVWWEDGERDPETWELLSDQRLRARWWPKSDSTDEFSISPARLVNRARPITHGEFQWLMALRTIKI